MSSVVAAQGALENSPSGCGRRASLPHGIWDLPKPRIEPVPPALAGGFLTISFLMVSVCMVHSFYIQSICNFGSEFCLMAISYLDFFGEWSVLILCILCYLEYNGVLSIWDLYTV